VFTSGIKSEKKRTQPQCDKKIMENMNSFLPDISMKIKQETYGNEQHPVLELLHAFW
jgi:hypothetical protein